MQAYQSDIFRFLLSELYNTIFDIVFLCPIDFVESKTLSNILLFG